MYPKGWCPQSYPYRYAAPELRASTAIVFLLSIILGSSPCLPLPVEAVQFNAMPSKAAVRRTSESHFGCYFNIHITYEAGLIQSGADVVPYLWGRRLRNRIHLVQAWQKEGHPIAIYHYLNLTLLGYIKI